MPKIKIYLIILFFIFVSTAGVFYSGKSNSPNKDLITVVNAKNILPYSKSISPRVGIIDTGVHITNKFLPADQIKQVTVDEFLTFPSKQIHGTMIAGIMISNGTRGSEPQGLIPNSDLFSIQTGTDLGTTSENLAAAIDLAIQNEIKILNISLATSKVTEVLKNVVKRAIEKDIVILSSAGNDGGINEYFPSSYDGVISVGAIDIEGNVLGNTDIKAVDIFAPGEKILTSAVEGEEEKDFIVPGNSGAVPIVTSTVAVLLTEYPELNSEQIKHLLKTSSTKKQLENGSTINILNVANALKEAKTLTK
ncbi:S8 family serine peptidase [Bacillaceae bacterium IKA-2]|nr:S8 family serine peptidase [Bacillaceae bacterium IKA-2]